MNDRALLACQLTNILTLLVKTFSLDLILLSLIILAYVSSRGCVLLYSVTAPAGRSYPTILGF